MWTFTPEYVLKVAIAQCCINTKQNVEIKCTLLYAFLNVSDGEINMCNSKLWPLPCIKSTLDEQKNKIQ